MTSTKEKVGATEIFLKSWQIYQEIIKYNYMFHHEISAALQNSFKDFKPNQKLRILDLGCGDASMVLPLLTTDRVVDYVGCDLSQPALDVAHPHLEAQRIHHKLICDDMVRVAVEQPADSYDVVFSSYALHHLNAIDKQKIVESVARVLAPQGRFILIDIFRAPSEDRAAYMRHYMGKLKESWDKISLEAQSLVINHATEYDFPEHSEFYQLLCEKVGLTSGVQLAKHTWHQAWLYRKTV